MSSES